MVWPVQVCRTISIAQNRSQYFVYHVSNLGALPPSPRVPAKTAQMDSMSTDHTPSTCGAAGGPIATIPGLPTPIPIPADISSEAGGGPAATNESIPTTTNTLTPADPTDEISGDPPPNTPTVPTAPTALTDYDKAQMSIISINTFNIIVPPRPLLFGTINPRKIRNTGVVDLADSFLDTFTPFKQDCMIPIILNRDEVSPACINLQLLKSQDLEELVLSPKGLLRPKLIACGGNHRFHAVKRLMTELDKQSKILQKEKVALEKQKEKEATGNVGGGGKQGKRKQKGGGTGSKGTEVTATIGDNDDEDIEHSTTLITASSIAGIDSQLAYINSQIVVFQKWGVIVYDQGTSV